MSPGNSNKTPSDYNIISFVSEWNTFGICSRAVIWQAALLCGDRAELGRGSSFPAFSIGTTQDVSFFLLEKKKKRFLGNARWSGLCLDWPHNPLTSKHFIMPVRLWWVMYYSSRLVALYNCCCLYGQRKPGRELAWSSSVLKLLLQPFQGKALCRRLSHLLISPISLPYERQIIQKIKNQIQVNFYLMR